MTLNIERLSVSSLDVKPINMSWDGASHEDYGDNEDGIKWNFWEAVKCDGCDRVLVGSGGYLTCADVEYQDGDKATCTHCDKAINYEDDDWYHDEPADDHDGRLCDLDNSGDIAEPESCDTETLAEGPMMNYWYPLDFRQDNEDAAKLLIDLPLCIVEVDGNTGLALTGGGMDLSWEIAEAFILLGYYPPTHFSDLPREARELSDDRKQIVLATMKANQIQARWAQGRIDRLAQTYDIEPPSED